MKKPLAIFFSALLLTNIFLIFSCSSKHKSPPIRTMPQEGTNYKAFNGIIVLKPTAPFDSAPDYSLLVGGKNKASGSGVLKEAATPLLLFPELATHAVVDPVSALAGATVVVGAGLAAVAVDSKTSPTKTGDFKSDIPNEPGGRDISKKESKTCFKTYDALEKAGFDPDLGQLVAEHFVRNGIAKVKSSPTETRECLYAYYLHRIAGGEDGYVSFSSKYVSKQLWLDKEIRSINVTNGRRLTAEEIYSVYKNCYSKNANREFRKALIEYRIENQIPGLKTTLAEYIKCISEYERQSEKKEFIAFEFDFMKKARETRSSGYMIPIQATHSGGKEENMSGTSSPSAP